MIIYIQHLPESIKELIFKNKEKLDVCIIINKTHIIFKNKYFIYDYKIFSNKVEHEYIYKTNINKRRIVAKIIYKFIPKSLKEIVAFQIATSNINISPNDFPSDLHYLIY